MSTRRTTGWTDPEPEPNLQLSLPRVIRATSEIVPGGILRAGKRVYNDNRAGWWLGVDVDGAAKFGLGDADARLTWDPVNGLVISADGAGLTNIDGAHIQTSTIAADKLDVDTLSAITAALGAVEVTDSVEIITAAGVVRGLVDDVRQWELNQYGLELVAHEDAQTLTFVRASNGATIGRLVGEEDPASHNVALELVALPATATANTSAKLAAYANANAGAIDLLAGLTMAATADAQPVARFSFLTPSTGIGDYGRIEAVNNTFGTIYNGRGIEFAALAETTTTQSQEIGRWVFDWSIAAHATRTGRYTLYLRDETGEHEVFSARPTNIWMTDAYCEGTLQCDLFKIADGDAHLLSADGSFSHGYDKVTGDAAGNVSALTLALRATTGTAPLTIASTTAVANLNADLLDGQHAAAFEPAFTPVTANYGLFGPTSGAAAAPTFRALMDADIPAGIVRNPVTSDVDFAGYKAIALICDNGTTFPATPSTGQWFYRTDIDVLFFYEATWKPIINFNTLNIYVATTGTNADGYGYAVDTPCATLEFAWTLVPSVFAGNVIINLATGNYQHPRTLSGKNPGGDFYIYILGATTEVLAATSPTATSTGSVSANATMTVSTANWGIGIVKDSGTNSSVTANKLVDSTQNFGTTVTIGMQVKNITDNTWAHVTAVDSNTTLSIDADIFTGISKSYSIGWGDFKGHVVKFADNTATSGLRGINALIYENNSTTLTMVGRFFNSANTIVVPTASDVFTIIKPATSFTSTAAAPVITQRNLIYKFVELNSNSIWNFSNTSVIFQECWFGRMTLSCYLSYFETLNCYLYNRTGSYPNISFQMIQSVAFWRKSLFNLAEYTVKSTALQGSILTRFNNRYCCIIENATTGLNALSFSRAATATATDTGWQFYRNVVAVELSSSVRSGSTDIFSGNTTNVNSYFLPLVEVFTLTNATALAAIADGMRVWASDQNSEAGNAGLHILTETSNTLKFGNRLANTGGRQMATVTKTTTYTATVTDRTILCDATAGAFTVTLPTAAAAYDSALATGTVLTLIKTDSGANAVTIDGDGSETINGATTQALAAQWDKLTIISTGTAWLII